MKLNRIVEEIELAIYLVLLVAVILVFLAVLSAGAYKLYELL